jgi:hypothetical protein
MGWTDVTQMGVMTSGALRPSVVRMRNRALRIAPVALCVGLLAACIPPFEGAPRSPRVGFVSDSVLGMTESRITNDLRRDRQVSFSRTNAAKVAELQGVADEYADQSPETVVISAGTNDNFGRVSPSITINELQKMAAKFRNSCLTFVTLNANTSDQDINQRARTVNNWIRTQSQVADWDKWVADYYAAGSPYGALTYDLIHVTPAGEPHLTNVITNAARRCLNRGLPFGSVDDATSPSANRVNVRGWAIDADTNNPIQVHVYADNVYLGAPSANTSRPDVGQAFPFGSNHGFDASFDGVAAGRRNICVFGINVGTNGAHNSLIGCRTITVA